MLRQVGGRSSALARAQAQLSGQRIPMGPKDTNDELQEYMNALNKKASVLKHRAPVPGLNDVSDSSMDGTETENNTVVKETGQLLKSSATQSRFLKKKQNAEETPLPTKGRTGTQTDNRQTTGLTPVGPSKTRSSAALRKLAELENKIMNRKLEAEISDVDSDLRTSDERPFSARSSSDRSGGGNMFLKKKAHSERFPGDVIQDNKNIRDSRPDRRNAAGKTEVTLESEEEEIKRLIGSSVEFSDENESWWKLPTTNIPNASFGTRAKHLSRTPSPPTKGSPRRSLPRAASFQSQGSLQRGPSRLSSRTPSPPSRGTPRHYRRARSLSRSPLSSVRSSLNSNSSPRMKLLKRSRTPLSGRSDIKSLDELFSRASLIEDMDDDSSAGSDFKVNVLSLDDLAPTTQLDTQRHPQTEERKQKTEEQPTAKIQKTVISPALQDAKMLRHPSKQRVAVARRGAQDTDSASEIPTETDSEGMEISEHLTVDSSPRAKNRLSGPVYTSSQNGDSTVRSAYTDDFEKSTHRTASEDTFSERPTARPSSSSDHSRSDSSSSLRSHLPKRRHRDTARRTAVKDMAVQTNDPAFIYRWSDTGGSAVLGPALGAAYTDPTPIASHIVSPDAVEAMTAYSPAVFALNDMLKQQLMLTQQFVELNRHLHLSLLDSLEGEIYHYVTLEETKQTQSNLLKNLHFPCERVFCLAGGKGRSCSSRTQPRSVH